MLSTCVRRCLPLFEAVPSLAEAVPWLSIGHWPTPVTEARHFADAKGLRAFYVKREDLSHPECGGNKIRGLEFLLADARRRGAKTLLTLGAAGSHHVCRTAWHARRLGLDTVAVVVKQPAAQYVRSNLLLGAAAEVKYVPANYATLLPKLAVQFLQPKHWHNGRPPYGVPSGGTSSLSCLGHVNAALELKRQIDTRVLPEPDYLYVALGSLGTAAGLAVGCKLAGLRTRVVGVVASYRWYCTLSRWARFARRIHRELRRHAPDVPDIDIDTSDLSVITAALGDGYARFTKASVHLARELYDTEGIELDGTYTAKTLDGAMRYVREHRLRDKVHLFWHTYQPAKPASGGRERIASLPASLRRYFIEETQPLDGEWVAEEPSSCPET